MAASLKSYLLPPCKPNLDLQTSELDNTIRLLETRKVRNQLRSLCRYLGGQETGAPNRRIALFLDGESK